MVGIQTALSGPHGDQPHQASAEESAGQHQGQEHICEGPERAHHHQPAGTPPGRRNHAGESQCSRISSSVWSALKVTSDFSICFPHVRVLLPFWTLQVTSCCQSVTAGR